MNTVDGIKVRVAPSVPASADVVAVPVLTGRRLPSSPEPAVDVGYLEARAFEGRVGEVQALAGSDGRVVLAVGVGDEDRITPEVLRRAAAAATRARGRGTKLALTLLDAAADGAQAVVEGALLASYAFTAYKSATPVPPLAELVVVSADPGAAAGLARGVAVARAVRLARDLVNEPAGSLTPRRLADVAVAQAKRAGLGVTVLDEAGARSAHLGGLLGVAAGSKEPPRLVELLYEPKRPAKDTPTVAFVGKGITFDSGGLSIKTAQGMTTMKTDMSGAAAVLAAMTAIAAVGAPVRVLGLCAITENMPSGSAIKPGDVLRIRNGKTVEVLNTDAEGRLVLADALSLAVEAGVDAIVDLATLTGAVSTALGRSVAGLMGSDPVWMDEVRAAADRAGEQVWPLPLPDEYRRDIDSDVADIRNTGGSNPAGTLTAGLFLKEFTDGLPWAHLDIAGVARSESDDGYVTKGGTAWGVRTLVELACGGRVGLREGAVRRARWAERTPVAALTAARARRRS